MRLKHLAPALAGAALVLACAAVGSRAQGPGAAPHGMAAAVTRAVAVLHETKKASGEIHGKVTFTQTPHGVQIVADIHGLPPGEHGFHVHEFGDCSSDDALSAGGHFNPTGQPHAAPTAPMRHVGDLGNIKANDKGHATLDLIDPVLNFHGPTTILGRSVIVHAKPDDLKTQQPPGAAGDRIACGVIGIAKGEAAAPATPK